MITQAELRSKYIYNQFNGLWFFRDIDFRNGIGCVASSYTNDGYVGLPGVGKIRTGHRLAFLYMTGNFAKQCVDHIDRVRDNNSWSNLRDVSHSENSRNSYRNGESPYSALKKQKRFARWQMIDNIKFFLKRTETCYESLVDMTGLPINYIEHFSKNTRRFPEDKMRVLHSYLLEEWRKPKKRKCKK